MCKKLPTKVRFTRAHTVVHPATVLEINGVIVPHTARDERRDAYQAGQIVEFRTKKDAIAFAKCMDGAAEVVS